jgi:hypothetical protein
MYGYGHGHWSIMQSTLPEPSGNNFGSSPLGGLELASDLNYRKSRKERNTIDMRGCVTDRKER